MFIVQEYVGGAFHTINDLSGDRPTPRLFATRTDAETWAIRRGLGRWRVRGAIG